MLTQLLCCACVCTMTVVWDLFILLRACISLFQAHRPHSVMLSVSSCLCELLHLLSDLVYILSIYFPSQSCWEAALQIIWQKYRWQMKSLSPTIVLCSHRDRWWMYQNSEGILSTMWGSLMQTHPNNTMVYKYCLSMGSLSLYVSIRLYYICWCYRLRLGAFYPSKHPV